MILLFLSDNFWTRNQSCGARAQAVVDDRSWSKSQKFLDGGARAEAWNLSSGSTDTQ